MSKDSSRIEITRRRILAGIGVVGVASAGAGAGTMALFSDTEESTGNTVQAGTLNLGSVSGLSDSWDLPSRGLAPGKAVSGSVTVTNDGSIDGDHTEIGVEVTGEADGTEPGDDELAADVSADEYAESVIVDSLSWGGSQLIASDAWREGVYYKDIDDDGSDGIEVSRDNPEGSSGRGDAIHVSSEGDATPDYVLALVDVAAHGFTLDALSNGTFRHDYYGSNTNEVPGPDEVALVVQDDAGDEQFLWYHKGSGPEADGSWKKRDLASELDGAGNSHDWFVEHPDGETESLGASPLERYGDATVLLAGIGCANTNPDNDVVVDMYYDHLQLGQQVFDFPTEERSTATTTLAEIDGTVFDNRAAPGSGTEFEDELRLDSDVGNDFQGDGVDVQFEFGLAQDPGQEVL